eukprot:GSMAST32.ASY1.ANO1.1295.1 assembled CDS
MLVDEDGKDNSIVNEESKPLLSSTDSQFKENTNENQTVKNVCWNRHYVIIILVTLTVITAISLVVALKLQPTKKSPNNVITPNNDGGAEDKSFFDRTNEVTSLVQGTQNYVKKAKRDDRTYKYITLSNKLEVLLVSDPSTDVAAASMSVGVGSLCDPEQFAGLAHFLEHMLFLGSEKFPNEDQFAKIISQHGGFTNAYTASSETNYHFNIGEQYLKTALKVWSQFFVSPLLTKSAIEREKNINNDAWRFSQLLKSTSSASHPYHKFATGNLDTLLKSNSNDNLEKALKTFFTQYYVANKMKLSILGSESVNDLQKYAKTLFQDIKMSADDSDFCYSPSVYVFIPTLNFKFIFFVRNFLGVQYILKPIAKKYTLEVFWFFPLMRTHFKIKPLSYIASLINEGKNSLLSNLRKKKWADNVAASEGDEGYDYTIFSVYFSLTELGVTKVDEILLLLFELIGKMRQEGAEEWRWRELQKISQSSFDYQEKMDPSDYVEFISNAMQQYPRVNILTGSFIFENYEADVIRNAIDMLTPERMVVMVGDPSKKDDFYTKEEHIYKTKYTDNNIPKEFLKKLGNVSTTHTKSLSLPLENQYISTDFSLSPNNCDQNSCRPKLLESQSRHRVWVRPDRYFGNPHIDLTILIDMGRGEKREVQELIKIIYANVLSHALVEKMADASVAGYSVDFDRTSTGVSLNIRGFSEKFDKVLKETLDFIRTFLSSEENFENFEEIVQSITRGWENFPKQQPYEKALFLLKYTLREPVFTPAEFLQELHKTESESKIMKDTMAELFQDVCLETLIYGNIDMEHGSSVRCQRKFLNSNAISTVIQLKDENENERTPLDVRLQLLNEIIQLSIFDELRTKQQLGYIVRSQVSSNPSRNDLLTIVQSPVKDAATLSELTMKFFSTFEKHLNALGKPEFENRVKALARLKERKLKSPSEEIHYLLSEIVSRQYEFNKRFLHADEFKKVTKQEIIDLFKKHIFGDGEKKILAIETFGKDHTVPKGGDKKVIHSMEELKQLRKTLKIYPHRSQRTPKEDNDVEESKSRPADVPTDDPDSTSSGTGPSDAPEPTPPADLSSPKYKNSPSSTPISAPAEKSCVKQKDAAKCVNDLTQGDVYKNKKSCNAVKAYALCFSKHDCCNNKNKKIVEEESMKFKVSEDEDAKVCKVGCDYLPRGSSSTLSIGVTSIVLAVVSFSNFV